MLLIDTSVWIGVFRDRSGEVRQQLETLIANRDVFLTRFTQLELLQGSLNQQEWDLLSTYLEVQNYVELTPLNSLILLVGSVDVIALSYSPANCKVSA
jgi:hypothetical protein